MGNSDQGLVNQYVEKIQALGVKALPGEDVDAKVEAVVDEALKHFDSVKTSDLAADRAAFVARLKGLADTTQNQPAYRKTVEHALSVIAKRKT